MKLLNLFKVSKYFKESTFNTDNSWIEYKILNFHDEKSQIFNKISLKVYYFNFGQISKENLIFLLIIGK